MRKLRLKSINRKEIDYTCTNCGPGTIISALENIVTAAEDSELRDEAFASLEDEFLFLKEKLSFTRMQSIIVAMLIDSNTTLETGNMARYLGVKNIAMLKYIAEIEELVQKRILRAQKDEARNGYQISTPALVAFMKNEVFVPQSKKNLSTRQLLETIAKAINEQGEGDITYSVLVSEVEEILSENKKHFLCKKVMNTDIREIIFFFFCVCKYVDEGDQCIVDMDIFNLYPTSDLAHIRNIISSRRSKLFKDNLLGDAVSEGFSPREGVTISEEIREYLDTELNLSWKSEEKDHREGLLNFENIKEKALYYNDNEKVSIDKLSQMLEQENFVGIQKRMKDSGVRSGFACLFYGAPGTGKTETALQLARATGRDIMQVNVANIKSKWVGDSEKNIRNIFKRYQNYCNKCQIKPILLFNEADAIINKRSTNVEHSVDKMENAIQNIILEEIETLDGILIATTNLTSNIDSAFERRFIYKVEFHKPNVTTKKHIWQSMINDLSEYDALILASEFDLSGGQIENVMRKQFVDKILYNEDPTLDKLRHYCTQENMTGHRQQRSTIGFK